MKILFFSPNSDILLHSIPETLLIKELLNKKNEVIRIYCDSLFKNFCSSMECSKIDLEADPHDKKNICKKCLKTSKTINQMNGVNAIAISNFIDEFKIKEVNNYIDNLNYENFSFRTDSFLSQKLKMKSLYETILKFKINDYKLNKQQFNYYKEKLRVSLYSYFSAKRIAKEIEFDTLIVYSPQYEINNLFCEGINSTKKIKIYFIEGSENLYVRHAGLRIWDWNKNQLVSPVKSKWDDIKSKSYPKFSKKIVKEHINQLINASNINVYSTKKNKNFTFKNKFDLAGFEKIFLLSMSSSDEAFAAYAIDAFPDSKYVSKVFKNQSEWVLDTIDFFKDKKEFGLIIRIHPREFSNRRENQISSNYKNLQRIFKKINLNNVYINYPSDNISIYNLFEIVDVTLVSWSLTAIESLLFNVPVIVYDNDLTNYPNELVISGSTKKDYYLNIENEFKNKSKTDLKSNTLLWLSVNHFSNSIFIKNIKLFKLFTTLSRFLIKYNLFYFLGIVLKFTFSFNDFDKNSKKRLNNLIQNKLDDLTQTL